MKMGYGGNNTNLSLTKPEGLQDAPGPKGTGYYGLLDLGLANNRVAVMLDITTANIYQKGQTLGTLYVGKKANWSLKEAATNSLSGCCGELEISYSVDYEGETTPLVLRIGVNANPLYPPEPTPTTAVRESTPIPGPTPPPPSAKTNEYSVNAYFFITSVRVGKLPETGEVFVVESSGGGARFDDLAKNVQILQDLNQDGAVTSDIRGEAQQARDSILIGAKKAWKIYSVSPLGRTVKLLPKEKGVLTGKVVTFIGAQPISGATVRLWPGEFETKTEQDGSYRLQAYEGPLWKMLVTKEGYIPFTVNYARDSSRQEELIRVRAQGETSYRVELAELPKQASGTATLKDSGSFYGSLGLVFQDEFLGDFWFQFYQYQVQEGAIRFNTQVCACREGQRGLVAMGDQGSKALDQIAIPPFGYSQGSTELKPGNVYVVKAREGLEGHFVLFRVDSVSQEGVKVSYLFK